MMMINWEVYYGENVVKEKRWVFIEKGGESPLHWRRRGKEYTLHRVVEPLPLATGELV